MAFPVEARCLIAYVPKHPVPRLACTTGFHSLAASLCFYNRARPSHRPSDPRRAVDREETESSERVPLERYDSEYVRANRLPASAIVPSAYGYAPMRELTMDLYERR